METSARIIGEDLRRIFAAVVRRPMGWNLINAFSHLEECEEALRESQAGDRPSDKASIVTGELIKGIGATKVG
jgi:hypothetical protein